MSTQPTVPIFSPDGVLGDIPQDQLVPAIKAGAKPGITIKSPQGETGVVPADRVREAVSIGKATIVPLKDQEIQHVGTWRSLLSDIGGIAKGVAGTAITGAIPGSELIPDSVREKVGLPAQPDPLTEGQRVISDFRQRKQAGYSLPYRITAPVAENALGVNVPGMEKSAREGDVGGVAGHALAVPAVMAATAGVARAAPAVADIAEHPAFQKAMASIKQSAKPALRGAARAASDIVDPELTGVVSPRLAHAQRVLGRVANALEEKPQTRTAPAEAGAPVERDATLDQRNIPEFAGEEKPPLVDMTDKLATELASKRNAPSFTAADRLQAKALLRDALKSSTADVVDAAVPGKNAAIKAKIDFYLQKGDIRGAEQALDQGAKAANPAWTPLDRQPVPSTNEIRARIQAEAKIPAAGSSADVRDTRALQQEMNWDLQRHGWGAESEARREFIARNSTGMTKGELGRQFAAQNSGSAGTTAPVPAAVSGTAAPDLTSVLQQSLDAVRKGKAQK